MFERLRAFFSRAIPESHDLGRAGERRAERFYRLRLYSVLARNLRYSDGEIDLVLRRGRTVVFAEVKTRREGHLGEPFEAVDRAKQIRIAVLAQRFLIKTRRQGCDVRFDVVSLVREGRRFRLTHFPDAFRPTGADGRPWQWR